MSIANAPRNQCCTIHEIIINEVLLYENLVEEAIRYCIKHDIMREYLLQHGSEVENMLLTEWNNDMHWKFGKRN